MPLRTRFASGNYWIETITDATSPLQCTWPHLNNALHWRANDLAEQRQHFERLGIDALDAKGLDGIPCLRIEPMDTGACAIVICHEVEPAKSGPTTAALGCRLVGIDIPVRAPERVAKHWAEILQLPSEHYAGIPCLLCAGTVVSFLNIEAEDNKLWSLKFATPEGAAVCDRASMCRFPIDAAGTGFFVENLHFSVGL